MNHNYFFTVRMGLTSISQLSNQNTEPLLLYSGCISLCTNALCKDMNPYVIPTPDIND